MKKRLARRGSHFWKIFALTLTGIISFVLVTGCSSSTGSTENPNADATQKEAGVVEGKTQGESAAVLPGEARIGIAYPEGDDEFTNLFITKTISYLVSAGIPEENITRMSGAEEELAENVKKLVDDKCSVLMVGGADENTAPGITDAAVKAKIPVVFFGTSPGEAEIARWEKKGIRASYVGGTYEQAAQKRADLIDSTGFEKLDQGKDDNVGLVVLYTGEDEPGDKVISRACRVDRIERQRRQIETLVLILRVAAVRPELDHDAAHASREKSVRHRLMFRLSRVVRSFLLIREDAVDEAQDPGDLVERRLPERRQLCVREDLRACHGRSDHQLKHAVRIVERRPEQARQRDDLRPREHILGRHVAFQPRRFRAD